MKIAVALILKNLISMIVGPKMIIWLLGVAAEKTSNKIDDHVVKIVKAGYENNTADMQQGIKDLTAQL